MAIGDDDIKKVVKIFLSMGVAEEIDEQEFKNEIVVSTQ